LLAEIGDERDRFQGDAQNLQCLGGTAPVTMRSGIALSAANRKRMHNFLFKRMALGPILVDLNSEPGLIARQPVTVLGQLKMDRIRPLTQLWPKCQAGFAQIGYALAFQQ